MRCTIAASRRSCAACDLPGYELFQYVDEDGETRAVDSADVNAYLKSIAGEEFTSKDFGTWAGTVLAAEALRECGPKNGLSHAIERVARQLGNTKAVCRKCYIHPAVIDAYVDGTLAEAMTSRSVEACVVRLLARGRRQGSLVPALKKSPACAAAPPPKELSIMLKPLSAALSFLAAATALAQTQPDQATPSVPPTQTPSTVTPATPPTLGGPPPALGSRPVGGLNPCENLIGAERDKCLQAGNAATGGRHQAAWNHLATNHSADGHGALMIQVLRRRRSLELHFERVGRRPRHADPRHAAPVATRRGGRQGSAALRSHARR